MASTTRRRMWSRAAGSFLAAGWIIAYARPYRTEVQLYKSLLALKRSIDRDCIVTSQREALQMLRCVISNLEYRFYKAYNMEFEDKRTVYSECAFRLIPHEDEPSVCLMRDWVYCLRRKYVLCFFFLTINLTTC